MPLTAPSLPAFQARRGRAREASTARFSRLSLPDAAGNRLALLCKRLYWREYAVWALKNV